MKLIHGDNKKLSTVCNFTDIKKAVSVANKLQKYVKSNSCMGLAANQFGIMERVCIAKIDGVHTIFINPVVTEKKGSQISIKEGCMSYPGVRGDIKRPERIVVRWLSVGKKGYDTTENIERFEGLDAIVLEHEKDHLDGIRCIDKMKNIGG